MLMEIVALKNFVPDDVNKLIFKFLGFPKKKDAEELNTFISLAVNRGAKALDPKNSWRFSSGREPEYYISPLLEIYWDKKYGLDKHWLTQHVQFKKTGKKPPDRAGDHIRKMFNKEVNKDTTEEKLNIWRAKFERQPVNIQNQILGMTLSSNKVKKYLYKGSMPEKIKEEVRDYQKFYGAWDGVF